MLNALTRSYRLTGCRQGIVRLATHHPSQLTTSSSFHASALWCSELPYHIVVGLPALSPTMDSGSLAEWYVQEGDSFSAGDVLAKIETDKASIDFEAQDDGSVAKLLMDAGKDIPIGTPIMITVEEADNVAAFKDYVHKTEEVAAAPAAATPAPTPPPVAAAPAPAPEKVAPPPPVEKAAPVAPPAPVAAPPTVTPGFTVAWGSAAATKSPMAKTLAKEHLAFLEKFGTTGQKPLL